MEQEIKTGLLNGFSYQVIAKQLLKEKRFLKDTEAFLHICRFIYQAGLYSLLIDTALSHLSQLKVIPWAFVMEILTLHNIKIPVYIKKAFLRGILNQDQIFFVLTSQSWDEDLPDLVIKKQEKIQQIHKEKDQKFVKLMGDLEFIRVQGFYQKEKEVLEELKKLEPDNPYVHEQWMQMKEKYAREILQNRRNSLPYHKLQVPRLDARESQQVENIVQSIEVILKEKPEKSYDMALFLSFIGYPSRAVGFLKNHLDSFPREWLYVDLLIQSELYLDCLSFLDKLEVKYTDDPEMAFSLAYARAKAYYGLGQKNKAKNILSELLKIRPKYRLAQFLLRQWESEEEAS